MLIKLKQDFTCFSVVYSLGVLQFGLRESCFCNRVLKFFHSSLIKITQPSEGYFNLIFWLKKKNLKKLSLSQRKKYGVNIDLVKTWQIWQMYICENWQRKHVSKYENEEWGKWNLSLRLREVQMQVFSLSSSLFKI